MSAEDKFDPVDGLIAIGLGGLLMLVIALGFVIFKDHGVVRYYVGMGQGSTLAKGFCVSADMPWDQDDVVYCSDNIANAKQVMADLNNELRNAPGAVK